MLEVPAQLGDAAVAKYMEDGVVCPPDLRRGLFTTDAMDNLFFPWNQHFYVPASNHLQWRWEAWTTLTCEQENKDSPRTSWLLYQYPPCILQKEESQSWRADRAWYWFAETTAGTGVWVAGESLCHWRSGWCSKCHMVRPPRIQQKKCHIWSQHYGSFPLLRDQAHSVATSKHVMDKISGTVLTVAFLNPSQVPVIAADQPIYSVAKQIQWYWPEQYGEDRLVIKFGGLHIELAALRSMETLLRDSGWTESLFEAGVASSGTAESFLSAASITRTRQAHQVTVSSLYKLLKSAYADYCSGVFSFEDWCDGRKLDSPQFHFWHLVLSMELIILQLIRAFREANCELYCQALSELLSYCVQATMCTTHGGFLSIWKICLPWQRNIHDWQRSLTTGSLWCKSEAATTLCSGLD